MAKKSTHNAAAKRERKAKKRKARSKQLERFRHEQSKLSEWRPVVEVEQGLAGAEFGHVICSAVVNMPYDNADIFPKEMRDIYAALKCGGEQAVWDRLVPHCTNYSQHVAAVENVKSYFGDLIISRLSESQQDAFFPFNDLKIEFVGRGIRVKCASLRQNRLNGEPLIWRNAPCYYSPHQPIVNIGQAGKIVAFSLHAVQQLCKRIAPHWRTYGGLSHAYGFLNDCLHFELTEIQSLEDRNIKQPAITFYQDCFLEYFQPDSGQPDHDFFEQVVGISDDLREFSQHWYYRVGYCPIEIRGEFAIATTFLSPGFRDTPENRLLKRSSLEFKKKRKLEELARSDVHDYWHNTNTDYFKVIKWFHDNGVPQVLPLEGEIFAPAHGKPGSHERKLPINSPTCHFFGHRTRKGSERLTNDIPAVDGN